MKVKDQEYAVELLYSKVSGKKKIIVNGIKLHEVKS
jgi:ribosomal protein L20A (L18A)